VESVFLGYNQNAYLCGNHKEHPVGSLEPAGKTNEAAVLGMAPRRTTSGALRGTGC
jgi:hypothetical protein